MAAVQGERAPLFGFINHEDEVVAKNLVAKAVVATATFPLSTCKYLIQLGHEPFALTTGRTLIVAGRNAYFLPNVFSYASQLARTYGYSVLFTGLDSGIASLFIHGYSTHVVQKYIDKYYPEIGGKPENLDADEKDLDDSDSFRRKLRFAMRACVVNCISLTVSRPFTVVMIRQIAQLIGNETKYGNLCGSLKTIGIEEGPAGLFSGLAPQLIGEVFIVLGIHGLSYLAERAVVKAGMYENSDEKSKKDVAEVRKFLNLAVSFVSSSFGYPYTVVSTIMAVTGSGLAVSFLPFSPSFTSWHSAWDYHRPQGLKRGSRLFLREHVGAVSVGPDQKLYASNKYFS